MKRFGIMRGLLIVVLAFFLLVETIHADPSMPELLPADWRTGQIEVCYGNVTVGNTIKLYTRKWNESSFTLHEEWIAESSEGCYLSDFYENGQTVWYYIRQVDANNVESVRSGIMSITPPITAYVINWPDMFDDLFNALKDLNNSLIHSMNNLMTPSSTAIDDLNNAINDLKNALGLGAVENAGNQIITNLDTTRGNLNDPIVNDDGDGTFTGGSTGGDLPFDNKNIGGLTVPDASSGTANDLSFKIPYMVDMNGDLVYIHIFTDEQMEKLKWWGLIRDIAGAVLFIMFAIWLVIRFAPVLKS